MLRVFTTFSGYDSQCLALDRLGIDYELVGWAEIDKYAIQAHNALYPQWKDKTIDKLLNAGISQSQLYKLAGNSIVVDVLYHIFRKMFVEKSNEDKQLSIFDYI